MLAAFRQKSNIVEIHPKRNFRALSTRQLPDTKECVSDFVVEMLMLDGIWRRRRIVWTKDILYITRHGTVETVDTIPLHEIEVVSIMNQTSVRQSSLHKGPRQDDSQQPSTHGHDINRLEFLVESTATHLLNIKTSLNGVNLGRTYYLSTRHCEDPDHVRHEIFEKLSKCSKVAKRRAIISPWKKAQDKLRTTYDSLPFQALVAVLIIANFVANTAQAQLKDLMINSDGTSSNLGALLDQLDLFFTAIFTAELLINAYANWLWDFVGDGWNVFDILVVGLSLAALGPIDLPANALRSMRAFRVIRLFGRLASLRDIIDALTAGIIPVLNALLILFVVSSIYAILAVTLFDSSYPDHFGRFDVALATLLAVAAGLDGLMTGMPDLLDGGAPTPLAYFVATFVVVVSWTLLQICVAVLLDSFLTARSRQDSERQMRDLAQLADRNTIRNTLDPLLQTLSRDYVDDADLTRRIHKLFETLDTDDSKGLSCMEFKTGIRKLNFNPPIHLSDEDFAVITNNGVLLDEKGQLGLEKFEAVMMSQIRLYIQRQMSNTLIAGANTRFEVAQLSSMKALYHDNAKLQELQYHLFSIQSRIFDDVSSVRQELALVCRQLSTVAHALQLDPLPAADAAIRLASEDGGTRKGRAMPLPFSPASAESMVATAAADAAEASRTCSCSSMTEDKAMVDPAGSEQLPRSGEDSHSHHHAAFSSMSTEALADALHNLSWRGRVPTGPTGHPTSPAPARTTPWTPGVVPAAWGRLSAARQGVGGGVPLEDVGMPPPLVGSSVRTVPGPHDGEHPQRSGANALTPSGGPRDEKTPAQAEMAAESSAAFIPAQSLRNGPHSRVESRESSPPPPPPPPPRVPESWAGQGGGVAVATMVFAGEEAVGQPPARLAFPMVARLS